jgi:hypothetical protein
MRPRDTALRQCYQAAAEELRALNEPVTPRTLSTHLPKEYDAVRTFFNRNRDLAENIGVKINSHHSEKEYFAARERLLNAGAKPTARVIASELGVDHSSVCRFFKRWTIPTQEKKSKKQMVKSPPLVQAEPPIATWLAAVRLTRELTVQHFDPSVLRVVLNKVSPAEYIQLWDKRHLLFQVEGLPKPDHLPTREEMSKFV